MEDEKLENLQNEKTTRELIYQLFIRLIEEDNSIECGSDCCMFFKSLYNYMKYHNGYSDGELNNIIQIYTQKKN